MAATEDDAMRSLDAACPESARIARECPGEEAIR
jgi:hypothetical protein